MINKYRFIRRMKEKPPRWCIRQMGQGDVTLLRVDYMEDLKLFYLSRFCPFNLTAISSGFLKLIWYPTLPFWVHRSQFGKEKYVSSHLFAH